MNPNHEPVNPEPDLAADLQTHLAVCHEILSLVEHENQTLRNPESCASFEHYTARKNLLPRLTQSALRLRGHRVARQHSGKDSRADVDCASLLRQNQDLIMKILFLDRENEQALLRRGLVPAAHLPSVNRQRPHYVADMYRRHSSSPGTFG